MHRHILELEALARDFCSLGHLSRTEATATGEKCGVYSAPTYDWHLIVEPHKEQLQRKVSVLVPSSSSSSYMKTAH